MIDAIIIEIISFSLSGLGLFNFISKYDVPEVRKNFYGGDNPFLEKANIIENTLNWFYLIPTIIGLILIPIKEIFTREISDRFFESNFIYLIVLIFSILISFFLFKFLTKIGKKVARKKWEPSIINKYSNVFSEIKSGNLLINNKDKAKKNIQIIEKALDINKSKDNLQKRYEFLEKFFV